MIEFIGGLILGALFLGGSSKPIKLSKKERQELLKHRLNLSPSTSMSPTVRR